MQGKAELLQVVSLEGNGVEKTIKSTLGRLILYQ